jgi:hypothetical protein
MNRWWKAEPVAWERGASPSPGGSATYGPFFLARMSRLSALRACRWLSPFERRLVDHALYTTYWDCVAVNAREAAIDVIHDRRHAHGTRSPLRAAG